MTIRATAVFSLLALLIGAGTSSWFFLRPKSSGIRVDTDRASVVTEIRQLGRLETTSFTIEKIIEAGKENGGAFSKFLFGDKLLLIAHGEVIGGLELSGLDGDDLRMIDGKLHLRLPAPQILSVSLDNEQTRVYDRSQGLFSRTDKDLETEARQAAEESIRDAACQAHILEAASENAVKQIKTLLSALGFENAVLEIASGRC